MRPHHRRLRRFLQTLKGVGDLRREENDKVNALAAYEELLSLHRNGVGDSENSEWQRTIWTDLNRLADLKLYVRDVDGALAAAEESLAIARKLSEVAQTPHAWASSRLSEIADITMGAIVRQLSRTGRRRNSANATCFLAWISSAV